MTTKQKAIEWIEKLLKTNFDVFITTHKEEGLISSTIKGKAISNKICITYDLRISDSEPTCLIRVMVNGVIVYKETNDRAFDVKMKVTPIFKAFNRGRQTERMSNFPKGPEDL